MCALVTCFLVKEKGFRCFYIIVRWTDWASQELRLSDLTEWFMTAFYDCGHRPDATKNWKNYFRSKISFRSVFRENFVEGNPDNLLLPVARQRSIYSLTNLDTFGSDRQVLDPCFERIVCVSYRILFVIPSNICSLEKFSLKLYYSMFWHDGQ